MNPAVAQNDAKVTARDVVDRESLKAFVLEAREYLDSFETLSGYRDALESFRAGGEWKQGSVYLYVGTTDGVVVFHAVEREDVRCSSCFSLCEWNSKRQLRSIWTITIQYVDVLIIWPDCSPAPLHRHSRDASQHPAQKEVRRDDEDAHRVDGPFA